MDLKRCGNGHYYDGDRYAACPHCENMDRALKLTNVEEVERDNPAVSVAWNNVDEVIGEEKEPAGKWEDELTSGFGIGKEEISREAVQVRHRLPDDDAKTIGVYSNEGEEPVVGWLVCIEGEHRGESFNLKEGMNFIGRDIEMDVPLIKDRGVSRDKHVTIVFDAKNVDFMAYMGASKELVYVNGKMLLEPRHLEAYDRISLGKTELLFVPFCCEKFNWEIS